MEGRNPRDKWKLKQDLLEALLSKDCIEPDNIEATEAVYMFPSLERDLGQDIIVELAENDDCPLIFSTNNREDITLEGYDETRNFMDGLSENPPWFEVPTEEFDF